MQKEPNTNLRDLFITCKLGKNFTKVVPSNGKNMNHSVMEHLMVCHCHELETNPKGEQNQRTLIFGVE